MMLLLGGGAFAWWNHKQNLPSPMWVPLPIRNGLGDDDRDKVVRDLREKLQAPEVLAGVTRDLDLRTAWDMESAAQAERELAGRIFVRPGDMDSPMGRVPAIHIGITGKSKESQLSGKIAVRLMDDVWKILGIEPPKGR